MSGKKGTGDSASFKVKWGKKAPVGKVFRTRVPKVSTDSAKKTIKSFAKQEEHVPINLPEANTEKPGDFIKRKTKKDKLKNRRQGTESGGQVGSKKHSLFSEKYKSVYINAEVKGASLVEPVFSAQKKFSSLELHRHLLSNLEKHEFKILTNVQEKSIPAVLSGQNCLIRSQTGSGKTLVYAVPILNKLVNIVPKLQRSDGIQAIIVVPTRELALQTHEIFSKLNTFQWIVIGHLCGGENRKTEKDKLRKGIHVLISTPGRILDHILHTNAFNAKNVSCLVLDEADRLLDMGFKKDIVRLVEELDNQKKNASYDPLTIFKQNSTVKEDTLSVIPARQTLLLSATLTKGLAELANFTMTEHIYIDALDNSDKTNPNHMIIPNTVKQEFLVTFVKHRMAMLAALLIEKSAHKGKTFVFMATTQMVDFHYDLFKKYLLKMPLNKGKLKVGDVLVLDDAELELSDDEEMHVLDVELFKLHGSMNQQERKAVFNGFKRADKGILLCTDVVARGIDVPEADCIIQYTGPQSNDDYLHRVGRTGRAGKSGHSVIFLTHEEQEFVTQLQQHKVFLKELNSTRILEKLVDFMEEPDSERATLALQRRFETAIAQDKELHKKACSAYTSWSRFYSAFPAKLKPIFDLKKVNLGHYVTSFGLKESPTAIAKSARNDAIKREPKNLNRKLANHKDNAELQRPRQKRPMKSISLTTSEFSSGLEPAKKRRKKGP